jgi:uncharacterized membrane protein
MKSLQLDNNSSQKIYDDYIVRCNKSLRILSEEDREDCLLEINSYIHEYLDDNKLNGKDEIENLLNILDRIGIPEETFKELIASKKIIQAVYTYNPKVLIQALILNIQNGFIYIILSILFLFLTTFQILIILKLIKPDSVGLYVGFQTFFFGFTDSDKNLTEVLGNWFIPTSIIISLVLYFLILFVLQTKGKPTKEMLENWNKDPNNWKWGWIYFNKKDKRIFPPKKNKIMGWTVNFANPISIITFIALSVQITVLILKFLKTV